MPLEIKNELLKPVYVPLNSGDHLRLSPGETSAPIDEVELKNNEKFEKLRRLRAISVDEPAAAAEGEAQPVAAEAAEAAAADDQTDESQSRPKPRKKG